jgi:hypothetical protein
MKLIIGRKMKEEPEITMAETKDQKIMLQKLRKELQIKPSTNLAVYRREDKLVVAKLAMPPLSEELKDLFREIDEQNKRKKKPMEKQTRNRRIKKRAGKMA